MPVYTYRCEICSSQFDHQQGFNDKPPSKCPVCGAEKQLNRVYRPVGVIFKGSGFYVTDNRTSSSKFSKNGTQSSSNGTDSESSKPKETKTSEAKAEKKSEKT